MCFFFLLLLLLWFYTANECQHPLTDELKRQAWRREGGLYVLLAPPPVSLSFDSHHLKGSSRLFPCVSKQFHRIQLLRTGQHAVTLHHPALEPEILAESSEEPAHITNMRGTSIREAAPKVSD